MLNCNGDDVDTKGEREDIIATDNWIRFLVKDGQLIKGHMFENTELSLKPNKWRAEVGLGAEIIDNTELPIL
ncbi:hypothetical protein TNCV_2147181 [Trichonephila clavipes]|uniref:Uncharacterized protein n=1 Tax=Trichonephila clavipes TaxID=2585209 RepID=A0A8X6SZ37_TRICX|nr:hypothetical protein TNCV_2147181 [Trichonephila clavipes]